MDDHDLGDLLHAWHEPRISPSGIARIRRDARAARPGPQLRRLSPWIAAAMAAGVALGFIVPANNAVPLVRHDLPTLVSWIW